MLKKLLAVLTVPILAAPIAAQQTGQDLLLLRDGRVLLDVDLDSTPEGVFVNFVNGKVLVPSYLIEDAVIIDAPPPEPTNDKEREMLEKGLVRFQGKWLSASKRDKLLAKTIQARRDELADIQEHKLWRNRYKEQTKHFNFEYTVTPHVFATYRDQLEAYFKVFAKDWKVKPPKDAKRLLICMYTNPEDFQQIGGVPPGVLGYFRFVEPRELNFFYTRKDPQMTTEVLFHEANHYMQKLIDLKFKMPHFPGEAIAEYYGGAHWDQERQKLTVGLILASRLTEVKTDIDSGKFWHLDELVLDEEAYAHYTWGWSLAHFLMKTPKYEKKFKKFVVGLSGSKDVRRVAMGFGLKTVRGKEVWAYFKKSMSLKTEEDVARMEKEWHDYIQNELVLEGSRGKEEAAFRAKSGSPSRPIRARRLFTEAIEEGSTNPRAFNALGELQYDKGEYQLALENFRKAVQYDPLDAEFTFNLGRTLKRTGDSKEGKRLIKLAQELGTSDPYLTLQFLIDEEDDKDEPDAD
jgi:tetratricopeptide (TPR) repeat protein